MLELHFEAEVGDGWDVEWVAMAWGVCSLSGMFGLQDADQEGGVPTRKLDVDGTTAVIGAKNNNSSVYQKQAPLGPSFIRLSTGSLSNISRLW